MKDAESLVYTSLRSKWLLREQCRQTYRVVDFEAVNLIAGFHSF